jgi:outer membrane protein OmpA-like peptidoglycan-associated protein
MLKITPSKLLAGTSVLAILCLGGCATEEYVDKQVAGLQAQVSENAQGVSANKAGVSENRAGVGTLASANDYNKQVVKTLDVEFPTASAKLSSDDQARLAQMVERLKSSGSVAQLQIEGHADVRGGKLYNQNLSRERASTVYRYLADQGIPTSKMNLIAQGEDKAKGSAASQEDMANDRKVTISLVQ